MGNTYLTQHMLCNYLAAITLKVNLVELDKARGIVKIHTGSLQKNYIYNSNHSGKIQNTKYNLLAMKNKK